MRLLIVEDDAMLADGLLRSLRQCGYAIDWFESAERAWLALEQESFDLVLLDLGLPGIDGLEWLARLRRRSNPIPVIVITARDSLEDRIEGLDCGADDYLVKPFAIGELAARLRALLRRGRADSSSIMKQGPLEMDRAARKAQLSGRRLELPLREWAMLELLMLNQGAALSKKRIVQSLSSWDDQLSDNAVEVYVSRLRSKLESSDLTIRTVRGFGYVLETAKRGA